MVLLNNFLDFEQLYINAQRINNGSN